MNDFVNGCFEFGLSLFLMLNIYRLHKDKEIKGVHWGTTAFVSLWGFWNLYYYPSIDQWYSFAGGIFVVTCNCIWLAQVLYYGSKNK